MANKFNLTQRLQNFEQLKRDLPKVLANDAQTFFANSFKDSGFTDVGLNKWKEPARRISGTKAYKYPKTKGLGRRTRAILVQSGDLRRAVRNSIRSISFNRTVLNISGPAGLYAPFHNNGEGKMPKRKFMGHSKTLERMQVDKIKRAIDKVWK